MLERVPAVPRVRAISLSPLGTLSRDLPGTSAVPDVRTVTDPAAARASIRSMVRQIDPNLPLTNVSTQMEQIDKRLTEERIFAQALALFGGIALILASIGLFGLMSYSVARRTN